MYRKNTERKDKEGDSNIIIKVCKVCDDKQVNGGKIKIDGKTLTICVECFTSNEITIKNELDLVFV